MFGKWSALPVSLFLSSPPPESRTTLLASRMIGRRGGGKKTGVGRKVGANNLGVIKAAEGKRSRGGALPLKRMGLRKGGGIINTIKEVRQVRGAISST